MTLEKVVPIVFARYPDLADQAVVERYPEKAGANIFAYQFMNAAGRNIATYIPDLSETSDSGGLQFQEGDGSNSGRPYDARLIQETCDIGPLKRASSASAEFVIRYVITVPCKDGIGRVLMHPAQGRYTYTTPEDAQAWIEGYLKNNNSAILDEMGRDLQVRACKCYPGHFDPMGIYFDMPDAEELIRLAGQARQSGMRP